MWLWLKTGCGSIWGVGQQTEVTRVVIPTVLAIGFSQNGITVLRQGIRGGDIQQKERQREKELERENKREREREMKRKREKDRHRKAEREDGGWGSESASTPQAPSGRSFSFSGACAGGWAGGRSVNGCEVELWGNLCSSSFSHFGELFPFPLEQISLI